MRVRAAVMRVTLTEDRPTDADDRRALLDRDRIVVGHAHRKLGAEAWVDRAEPFAQLAKRTERGPGGGRGVDQTADGHQARDPEMRKLEELAEAVLGGVRVEAGLRGVVVDVHLEQHGEWSVGSQLPGDAVEALRERHGIDGLDPTEQLDGAARLVRLQRPDELPGDLG